MSQAQAYATTSNRIATSKHGSGAEEPIDHDIFGNVTSMAKLDELAWDAFGNLHRTQPYTAGTQRTFYVYDASGNRVRKVTETEISSSSWLRTADTTYLGGFELHRTWTGDGTTLDDEIETVHVMDGGSRLAIVETQTVEDEVADPQQPKWRYQLDDLIGSSCVEVGRDGQVISYEEFHAYGTTALLIDTGGAGFKKRYRWSGKERDSESGLVYFGARYFAPWLGRWASADPAGNVDSNPYRVVRGNPVGLVEKDGRSGATEDVAEGGGQGIDDVDTSSDVPEMLQQYDHVSPLRPVDPGGSPGRVSTREHLRMLQHYRRTGEIQPPGSPGVPEDFNDADGGRYLAEQGVNVAIDVGSEVFKPVEVIGAIRDAANGDYAAAALTLVPLVPSTAVDAARAARTLDVSGPADETLYRLNTDRESAARLARKAEEAEANIGIHGVSVSASEPTAPASSATRPAVEEHFVVHNTPTRRDPLHRTVELPKPVTQQVAELFNRVFRRNKNE